MSSPPVPPCNVGATSTSGAVAGVCAGGGNTRSGVWEGKASEKVVDAVFSFFPWPLLLLARARARSRKKKKGKRDGKLSGGDVGECRTRVAEAATPEDEQVVVFPKS